MQVFHGSDIRIENIDLSKSEYFKDFGRGFYVTNIREQAYLRALDVAKRHNSNKPVVTEYNYMEAYPITVGMKVKKFEDVSKEWVEFIILNRNRQISHPAHTFDIVEGPIANDKMVVQIRLYEQGKIPIDKLIEKLTYRDPTHQICFCTLASLYALELIEDKNLLFTIDEIINNILERTIIDFDLSESEALKLLYFSKFYKNLTDSDSLLWKNKWQINYEIFKKEINF
jgi:hypothetical protein